jgi:uncharacterized phage protein (TIGR01671 family)
MPFDHMKYRVWDKSNEQMDYGGNLHEFAITPEGILMHDWGDAGFDEVSQQDYVLMRSTGIKDRDGIVIYESDVLDVYNWGAAPNDKLLHTAVVIWNSTDKVWDLDPFYDCDSYDRFRNVKIIGNIYEHPKLMEKKKNAKNKAV